MTLSTSSEKDQSLSLIFFLETIKRRKKNTGSSLMDGREAVRYTSSNRGIEDIFIDELLKNDAVRHIGI